MKSQLILLSALSMVIASCKQEVRITTGNLQMEVNDRMEISLSSTDPSSKAIYDGFYAPDKLYAREFSADLFTLTSLETDVNDQGENYILTGEYEENGFHIVKHQKITAKSAFPGMLFFETYYINKGKEATVTAWQNHNLRIAASPEDSVIWSFQPSSTSARKDWILPVSPDFYQKNYLGMNNSDYGGGIPLVDLWRRDQGIATGIVENTLKLISMPVSRTRYDNYASCAVSYEYEEPVVFNTNDTIRTYDSFIQIHSGDFFNPLHEFSAYMQAEKGIVFPEPEPEACEPVWCAWGYERMFTIDEVIGTLPKVKELGFKWVDVDDGYQIAEGDWETNSRFPGGDRDMRRLTDEIHKHGMKAKLWWAPLAADPGTKILKEHPEVMLQTKEYIPRYISWWDSYYLSPVNPATISYTDNLLKRFMVTWNFDGLKLDGQHLNCCPADYNPASNLQYPEQAVEKLPSFFKNIYDVARSYKSHAVIQNCPCGTAINFFNIPYMNQAVASDPTSSRQIRMKNKAYKAITDKLAYYADHVELSDNGNDFASQVGIGGVIGSKFTYPKDNPHVKQSYLLTPEKESYYKKWVGIYNDKMLSKGKYLNLYDIGFDKPETHVIQKGDTLYYSFYADEWNGEPIELRGLENKTYTICEYTSDDRKTYGIDGAKPVIKPEFKNHFLIEVY